MHKKLVFAALLLTGFRPACSQVIPAATQGGLPLTVGVGFSDYYTEIYSQRFKGTTVWADWNFQRVPWFLRGIGVEAEARYLNFGQPAGSSWTFATAGGGPIYTWRHYRKLHPYGKFLIDYGTQNHISSPLLPSWYKHDQWTALAPGGGVDYRAWRNISVRADYEYQFWRVEWFNNHFLNPQGVTVGASYDFMTRHNRR